MKDHDRTPSSAVSLQALFDATKLNLTQNVSALNSHSLEALDGFESDETEAKDPGIIAADVATQIVLLSFGFESFPSAHISSNASRSYAS